MKKIVKWIIGIVVLIVIMLVVIDLIFGYLLFNFAFGRKGIVSFYNNLGDYNTTYYPQNEAQTWHETTKNGTKLMAYYLPAPKKTNKTVIVVHGFGSNAEQMTSFVKIFRNDGYNVLAPDSQGFGKSGGNYVGFGEGDVPGLVQWIHQINQRIPNSKVGMFGVSMGASEVMFALPKVQKNVKFAIADSGYASIEGELGGQINALFKVPNWMILPATNVFVETLAHYNLYAGNTAMSLKHNQIPLFIIQGKKDSFVPPKNAKINYRNDFGKKKLWLVPNANHIQSRSMYPDLYNQKVSEFSAKYFR